MWNEEVFVSFKALLCSAICLKKLKERERERERERKIRAWLGGGIGNHKGLAENRLASQEKFCSIGVTKSYRIC